MDIYPKCLAAPTGSDFAPVLGEAGVVDGPLVRVHDQSGQTVHAIFVAK